ncbi:cell cycle checkpoint control protein RAD9B isoform X2 [Xiphias gladius]|uniref:cell cycle checkpoint control protein RAD9B isoform X2 n=1 Tax=Xiphias gladius TaxID=8245 RepID=UPI001A9A0363|nr:cell cycle checkpoint control protein RAD9B isoform X2 [Xiphias gladius]
MNCVVEGNGVKAFGKAIHALSRIGEELWLDPMVKGLALRSVNAAQSAYTCFLFSPLFFQHYSLGSGSEQGNETIKCKLVLKESEALQAVFASHLCPNVLKAPARLLGDMVMHFPVSQEEITLSMTPLRVSLRNYFEEGNDRMKMTYTEMSLHPDEFDYFQIGVDSDITFCLKELRGFLSFAESHCLPLSVHFGSAGKPVCFFMEDMVLEATVVLATLIDYDNTAPSQPIGAPHPTTPRCADAAALPVVSYKADSSIQDIPAVTELIASSQGSPMIHPPALMQFLPQIGDPDGLCVSEEACASATTTPASTTICSLLFRALSPEPDQDGCAFRLSVLACYSDTEEDMEENYARSPSL